MELEHSCLSESLDGSGKTVGTQTSFDVKDPSCKDDTSVSKESVQNTEELNSYHSTSNKIEQEIEFETRTLRIIEAVLFPIEKLREQIENFSGSTTDDKDYKYLDEMLIRALVTLDELPSNGNPVVKQERKRAVQYVQKFMKVLDARLRENRDALLKIVDSDEEI